MQITDSDKWKLVLLHESRACKLRIDIISRSSLKQKTVVLGGCLRNFKEKITA